MRKKIFFVESNDTSYCPICCIPLEYRDSCKRIRKLEGGIKTTLCIRRLKCPTCGKLHRELPDIITPFKHYETSIISGVLDGVILPSDEDSEDYPCEMTMIRWHSWLLLNLLRIDGYLRSIGYRLLGFREELLKSDVSLLENMRSSMERWLEIVLRFIYNSGGFLVPAYV